MKKYNAFLWLAAGLLVAVLTAALAPLEKTLGANARFVYFHGAWVWASLFGFLAAALTGLVGLLAGRAAWHSWSRALGRSALVYWILFLPMSLWVMQANWNGLFLDEPRFRIPLNLAIVGALLQIGLSFFPPVWTSAANVLFGATLFYFVRTTETVLHPDSPLFNPEAGDIRLFFIVLALLLAFTLSQLARLWRAWEARSAHTTAPPLAV